MTQLKKIIVVNCEILKSAGLYQDKEFLRVGYFVNNELDGDVQPSGANVFNHIIRSVLTDKPRVTRFPIGIPLVNLSSFNC